MSMPGFTPTHVIPAGGLPAWSSPDPSQPVVATIEARVEVVVREERGAWAEVLCNNGWSAWVDGRRLVPVNAAAPPLGPPPAGQAAPAAVAGAPTASTPFDFSAENLQRLATPPMVGALVLIIGTLLPWGRQGLSGSAFDVPITFLVDYKTTGSGGFKLGLVLLALGVAGAFITTRADLQRYRVGVGGAAAAAIVIYLIQLQRIASQVDISITKFVGFGVIITLAGAVALAAAPLAWPGQPSKGP
jgi:hypothetical protein